MGFKISNIEGNFQKLDGGAMFGNAPRVLWQNWMKPDELGRISLATRGLYVTDGHTSVLCEAGIGSYMEPKLAERYGVENSSQHQLLLSLAAQGIDPEDLDYIILSHLHFDHVGGLLASYDDTRPNSLELVFSKAKFITSRTALMRALKPHPRDRASFIPGLAEFLQASGRLILIEDGQTSLSILWPDRLSFFMSHGHTPGQLHSIFRGATYQLVFCGDLVPGAAWVHQPISMGYDRFAELVGDEKKALYDHLLLGNPANNLRPMLFFTHDPKFPAGVLQANDKGRYGLECQWDSLSNFTL